jgi:hypothetical protein
MGKLSETVRGLAELVDPVAQAWAKVTRAMLHGIAGVLEAGPLTIPGPKINAPTTGGQ